MRRYSYFALTLALLSAVTQADTPDAAVDAAEAPVEAPAPKAAPIERAAVLERSAQHALTQALPGASEQQMLKTPNGEFLALWQPAHTAKPQGVVILLPGQYQHVDQPGVIQPLRTQLPQYGWHTLSLSLPEPYNPVPVRQAVPELVKSAPSDQDKDGEIASPPSQDEPAAEPIEQVQAEPAEEPEAAPHAPSKPDTDPRLEYAEALFDRLDAALAFVKAHNPSQLVLLGHGSGAYWSARYVQNRTPADVTGLIWVSADDAQGMTPTLQMLLGELEKPVVDLYERQTLRQQQSAQARKAQSLQLGLTDYRSVGLSALPNPIANQEQLVKRVRAALTP